MGGYWWAEAREVTGWLPACWLWVVANGLLAVAGGWWLVMANSLLAVGGGKRHVDGGQGKTKIDAANEQISWIDLVPT